jgi:hypothetical protein
LCCLWLSQPRANHDEDGFLVQDGNEDDFVEKLNRLIRSGLEEVSGKQVFLNMIVILLWTNGMIYFS